MRLNRYEAEVVEPSFSRVGAVADDEMITRHRQVAHEVTHFGIGESRCLFAKQDGVLCIADGHSANTHVVVEIDIDGLAKIARLDVGPTHVAVAQRAFDVNLVLVVDEGVILDAFIT